MASVLACAHWTRADVRVIVDNLDGGGIEGSAELLGLVAVRLERPKEIV
jgi:hypothetical protein